MQQEILKRIKESKKDLDKKSQQAELLIRNEKFRTEFNKFIDWLPHPNKFFAIKIKYPSSPLYPRKHLIRKGILRI